MVVWVVPCAAVYFYRFSSSCCCLRSDQEVARVFFRLGDEFIASALSRSFHVDFTALVQLLMTQQEPLLVALSLAVVRTLVLLGLLNASWRCSDPRQVQTLPLFKPV